MPGLLELLDALERAANSQGHRHQQLPRVDRGLPGAVRPGAAVPIHSDRRGHRHGKPDPEIYLKAAARIGVPPRDVLVLEDSQNGCRAAAAAGAFTVAVPGEHSRGHDFSVAALVIDSLADRRLYKILDLPRE